MRRLALATTAFALVISGNAVANAAAVPCEDMLKQLRDAEKTAALSEGEKSKVSGLGA